MRGSRGRELSTRKTILRGEPGAAVVDWKRYGRGPKRANGERRGGQYTVTPMLAALAASPANAIREIAGKLAIHSALPEAAGSA